ncbi:twin-arginine translocation signal domain-containing protein [Chthonobacter rhizosphaerae]|uniref:twin-arginine translocation signal domain-containing protein n=1 Tax=Chthonobacter rhizosphaerae TaxID=2735553 RepID=UPI0015EFD46A|nr:twin-arginine translocation signal domain-containing protein [Chthonobacter rhizosphaerae]
MSQDETPRRDTPDDLKDPGRRAFLTGAGLAGAAAAAGGVVLAEAREAPEEQVKTRYSETPHVKRFYDLNRI